ncbi:hypothetical protein ACI65C_012644 [Semiaphis heraclei]
MRPTDSRVGSRQKAFAAAVKYAMPLIVTNLGKFDIEVLRRRVRCLRLGRGLFVWKSENALGMIKKTVTTARNRRKETSESYEKDEVIKNRLRRRPTPVAIYIIIIILLLLLLLLSSWVARMLFFASGSAAAGHDTHGGASEAFICGGVDGRTQYTRACARRD